MYYSHYVDLDSIESIATRYGLDNLGIKSPWGARISTPVQTGLGALPSSYKMGTRSLYWG